LVASLFVEQVRAAPTCDSLANALAMTDDNLVFRCSSDTGRWFCVVVHHDLKFGVELAEEQPGSGDMAIVGLEVRSVDESLTVGALRGAPYGPVTRAARAAVQEAGAGRRPRMLARPSDPPPAFRGDRRGRAARTDEDYAQLAVSYLALAKDARRHAAAIWAERYPEGGSKRTWLNRLVRAKRYVEGEYLSEAGMALVYGEDWIDRFDFDAKWDSALNIATMAPGGATWRRLQRDGRDPKGPRVNYLVRVGFSV
jgi:hypothetical protein